MKTLLNSKPPVSIEQPRFRHFTGLHEPAYSSNPFSCSRNAPRNKRRNTGKAARALIDALFIGCIVCLASCAWIQSHKPQLTAVGEVALSHIAKDAYAIGLAAFSKEMSSDFSTDMGYALQMSARDQLPYIVSSENLSDYLKAWNTSETDAMAALVPQGLDAPSAQKVALVIADSQAAAIPSAE